MQPFEYAQPRTVSAALKLLSDRWGECEILAGGTDLVPLLKSHVQEPRRVVNIMEIPALCGVSIDADGGLAIGAATPWIDLLEHPAIAAYPAFAQALAGMNAMQLQSQATLGGDLCARPRCWYYRQGRGYFADDGRLVAAGDNRYHAIFDNAGPAKFISGSRTAASLIALDAVVRIATPSDEGERFVEIADFFHTPRNEAQRETALAPDELLTHVLLPPADGRVSATYEVKQSCGPDYPLASAATSLKLDGSVVRQARVVLGQVAPRPWISRDAAAALVGRTVNESSATAAGLAAVEAARPLSGNAYKVQLAKTAVKRAVLQAAGVVAQEPAVA